MENNWADPMVQDKAVEMEVKATIEGASEGPLRGVGCSLVALIGDHFG